MQLTGQESVQRGMLKDTVPAATRAASYDIRVGTVIIDGKVFESNVAIKPQQTVIIVSKETVEVPAGFVGYVMPKTSLCNDGILTLNTGILDPGYTGLISTTAINFDRESYTIRPNDPFLRVVFHQLQGKDATTAIDPSVAVDRDTYLRLRTEYSSKYPSTFLDIPGQIDKVTQRVTAEVLGKERNFILLVLAILT